MIYAPKLNTLVPSVFFTIAAALLAIFFFLNKDQKKISLKIFLLYTLCSAICFALTALIGLSVVENALSYFIGIQFVFFLLGVGHSVALYFLSAKSQRESFWDEFVFSLFVAFLGGFIFILLFNMLKNPSYTMDFLWALLFFLVPFFVLKTFDYLIAIPQEEYAKWYYPVGKELDDIDDEDMQDKYIIVISLQMERSEGGEVFTTTGRAPLRMFFGTHFACWLYEFNDAYPGKKIQYLDEYGQPQGWNFYVKPAKWYQSPRYINPELTINENEIKEKDTIVCERV